MELQLAAFDRSVRCFADVKTSEGLAIVTHFEPEEKQPCAVGNAVAAALVPLVTSAVNTRPIDPLMYWLYRRWLTGRRQVGLLVLVRGSKHTWLGIQRRKRRALQSVVAQRPQNRTCARACLCIVNRKQWQRF
jgi:hypothetical protein